MTADILDDYRWLISDEGVRWYDVVAEDRKPIVQQAKQLRKHLPANRVHLLLELIELRERAATKFEAASRLFFTASALEQATDQWVASYKAQRFPTEGLVADLCCGIGGDLFGLAARGETLGVDHDPVRAMLAAANCGVLGLTGTSVRRADVTQFDLRACAAWHIDPDRRTTGRRTSQLNYSVPSSSAIEQMMRQLPHAALKAAPAAELPSQWKPIAERQWIGSGRECKQQVIWFGNLATHLGQHTAVVVQHRGQCSELLVGVPSTSADVTESVERYVCEPHAAVLAARLTGALAQQRNLFAVGTHNGYLTADHLVDDPLLSCFSVLDVLPLDQRRLRATLRHHNIGQLEVKKRGVQVDPEEIRRAVQGRGDQQATLLVTHLNNSVHGILARRVD